MAEEGLAGASGSIKTPNDFIAAVNSAYKSPIMMQGTRSSLIMKIPRFSSGILSLDEALGGGWPFGRIALIAGEYSTGKTEIAMQAVKSIENYDRATRKHKLLLPEGAAFSKCRALWLDVENAFDIEWAKTKGLDLGFHSFAKPETAEQAIDIITLAIDSNIYDLIILDSIAQMAPSVEMEASSEDWQMGLAARLNNKAFRKWGAKLAKTSIQTGSVSGGPAVICLNQFRLKIGVVYGDPRTLPGGKQQGFAASTLLYTREGAYDAKEQAAMSSVELSGIVYKNKVGIPRQNYAFNMQLKDGDNLKKGEINNTKDMLKRGKELGLIVKNAGAGYTFAGRQFRTLEELGEMCKLDPMMNLKLWRSIIKAHTGVEV